MEKRNNYIKAAGLAIERITALLENRDQWSSPAGAANSAQAVRELMGVHDALLEGEKDPKKSKETLRTLKPGTAKNLEPDGKS